jgi:AraC-like DNA-binding protein
MLSIELKPVETLLFRSDVVAMGTFRCPATHPMFRDSGPCTHNSIVFPRTSTIIRHRGRSPFTASPNCATLYYQHQEYTRVAVSSMDASDWFVVADDLLLPFRETHVPVTPSTYLRQRRLFENVNALEPLAVDEEALSIAGEVMSSQVAQSVTRPMRERVEAAKRMIAAAPARRFSLKQLATATECSPFHLCRAFRATTGTSMTKLQQGLRLRLALDLLRDTRIDLSDIALRLGFASHSHFTSLFRRHFGETPSSYRRSF